MEKDQEPKQVHYECLLGKGRTRCETNDTEWCETCGFNPQENDRRRKQINKGRGLMLDPATGLKRLYVRRFDG